ncbi:MAG: RES family NAD+ phosphorylase [Nitriliruptoraceae bacterium]
MTQQLPEVPAALPRLQDEHLVVLPAGTALVRLHDVGGRHPSEHDQFRWFGPLLGGGRFDHHPAGPPADHAPQHGLLYAALDDPTTSPQPAGGGGGTVLDVVSSEAVQDGDVLAITDGLTLTVWRTSGELRLLDLRGPWAQRTRVGVHLSTAPHERTQPWARAIRRQDPQLHGLLYTPATGGRAVAAALNETSGPYLGGRIELSRRLHHPQLLPLVGEVGRRLGFSIEVV